MKSKKRSHEVSSYTDRNPEKSTFIADTISNLKGLPIDEFFDKSFKHLLLRSPQSLTDLGISESYGLRNNTLDNFSDAYIRETQSLEAAILDLLRTYDYEELTPEQQISYDVYEWYLDDLVRGHKFMYHNYLVHYFLSSYNDDLVRFFTECHPLTSREDAQDYVERLSQVDLQVDQVMEGLKLREKTGVVPPVYIVEMTEKWMMRYLHINSQNHTVDGKVLPVYTVFEEKLGEIDVDPEEKQSLLDAALREIEKSFIPAFVRLLDYVQFLKTSATEDAGVWKFPDGDEYYAYILRRETSTELTPDEVHQIGLAEVDRIHKEMYTMFDELGYPHNESFGELLARAVTDSGSYDTSTPEGKDSYLEAIRATLDEMKTRLDTVVDIHPRTALAVVGDPNSGVNFYASGSLDGVRPGAFHVSVGRSRVSTFSVRTVAYHEAIPGHHFQISLAKELDVPLFRNAVGFNGYVEGWAMYAEQLAWELGLYEDDPCGNLGRLFLELLRAVRLVVDTGIHAKRWTRKEARTYVDTALGNPYMCDALGIPPDAFMGEVNRYIVIPGQAVGYKVGMLKILELREKAKTQLGDQFDLKTFHRVVLGSGSMPLEILEQVVQDYIDAAIDAR
jgi:uncharacterized protein (DUF885 family)